MKLFFYCLAFALMVMSCNNKTLNQKIGTCTIVEKIHFNVLRGNIEVTSPAGDTITLTAVPDYIFLNVKKGENLEVDCSRILGGYSVTNFKKTKKNEIGKCVVIKKLDTYNEMYVKTYGEDTVCVSNVPPDVYLNKSVNDTVLVKTDGFIGSLYVSDKK